MSLSEAERRREERRRKILENSSARLQRITDRKSNEGADDVDDPPLLPTTGSSESSSRRNAEKLENFAPSTARTEDISASLRTSRHSGRSEEVISPRIEELPRSEQLGPKDPFELESEGIQIFTKSKQTTANGSTSRLPVHYHLLCILLLSSTLTLFFRNTNFLFYVAIYETTVLSFNGFKIPSFYEEKTANTLLSVFLLFGVRESLRSTFKTIMSIVTWVSTDVLLFIFCTLLCETFLHAAGR